MTLDIGNLYQEVDQQFCISPRSKRSLYTYCIIGKPMRLLIIDKSHQYNDDTLKNILEYLNGRMLLLDGFIWGIDDPIIWLNDTSSIICQKMKIPNGYTISSYEDFITSYSDVSPDQIDLPVKWRGILCN